MIVFQTNAFHNLSSSLSNPEMQSVKRFFPPSYNVLAEHTAALQKPRWGRQDTCAHPSALTTLFLPTSGSSWLSSTQEHRALSTTYLGVWSKRSPAWDTYTVERGWERERKREGDGKKREKTSRERRGNPKETVADDWINVWKALLILKSTLAFIVAGTGISLEFIILGQGKWF